MQDECIRRVELVGCNLRDLHIEKLVQALIFRRSVAKLSLADNTRVGLNGMKYISLVRAYRRVPCCAERVSLYMTLTLWLRFIVQLLARSIFLSYLNLSGLVISSKMANLLETAIPTSKLRTLILHRAGLKSLGSLGPITQGCSNCCPLLLPHFLRITLVVFSKRC